MAYILNMHSYSNAYIYRAGLAGLHLGCAAKKSRDDCWLAAGVVALPIVPADGVQMSTLLLGRPGLQRTARALGAVLRNVHNTTRLGLGVPEHGCMSPSSIWV